MDQYSNKDDDYDDDGYDGYDGYDDENGNDDNNWKTNFYGRLISMNGKTAYRHMKIPPVFGRTDIWLRAVW